MLLRSLLSLRLPSAAVTRIHRPARVLLFPSPSTSLAAPYQQPRRSIVHLPLLLGGAKVLSLLLFKKAAVFYLIKQVGINESMLRLRAANDQLLKSKDFSPATHAQVASAIDAMEHGLKQVDSLDMQSIENLFNSPTLKNTFNSIYNSVPSTPEFKAVVQKAMEKKS